MSRDSKQAERADGVGEMRTTVSQEASEALLATTEVLAEVASSSLAAASDEVTESQYRVLVVLHHGGPKTMTALAAALGVAASSLTRACDRLVLKNLITRSSDPGDRRAVRIELADQGRRIVRDVTSQRREKIEEILRGIGMSGQRAIAAALRQFTSAVALGSAADEATTGNG